MKHLLVADSSCDLHALETPADTVYESAPFHMIIDERDYVDDADIDIPRMVEEMERSEISHSACPSPEDWVQKFLQAENVLAFTISSNLSGSYNSALTARQIVLDQHPEKRIEIVDSFATGPKLVLLAQMAAQKLSENIAFDKVCDSCREAVDNIKTVFTLSSFHNLVQNGRVNKTVGFLAGKLGIRVIGVEKEGRVHPKEFLRGDKRALRNIIKLMDEEKYNGGPVSISHCLCPQLAADLKALIVDKWNSAVVSILPTRGLDSYYAERNGLIVCYPV